jgi:hypothetical protein
MSLLVVFQVILLLFAMSFESTREVDRFLVCNWLIVCIDMFIRSVPH